MKNLAMSLTLVLSAACSGGPDAPASRQAPAAAPSTATASVGGLSEFDASLGEVARGFSAKLRPSGGIVTRLRSTASGVSAAWRSDRCEDLEADVLSFLVSLHRGHPSPIEGAVEAEIACNGATRKFSVTGARFEQYRSGEINDPDILRGLK